MSLGCCSVPPTMAGLHESGMDSAGSGQSPPNIHGRLQPSFTLRPGSACAPSSVLPFFLGPTVEQCPLWSPHQHMSWRSRPRRATCRCTTAAFFLHCAPIATRCARGRHTCTLCWHSCFRLATCRFTTIDAELHFWQAPLARALFSERCSSNTRPAHRCTMAIALHLRVLRLRLRCIIFPLHPQGDSAGPATPRSFMLRAYCKTSSDAGPPLA